MLNPAPTAPVSAPVGWRPAAALGGATFLFWTSLYLYVPFLPGYIRSFGASAAWIGLITASYGFTQLVLRLPAGIWSDRLGRRRPFILAGCALAAASGAAFAAAGGPAALAAARTLAGIAATTWLAFTVLYTSYFPGRTSPAMAVVTALSNTGILVGQVAGPLLAAQIGPVRVFWLAAATAAAALGLAALAPDRRLPSRGAPTVPDLLQVARNRQVLTVSLLAAVAVYLVHGGSFVFVYDWAQQRLGAATADLGALSLYSGVPGAIASLAGAWLLRRWPARTLVAAGFVTASLAIAAVPLVPNLAALYWTQAVGGMARGLAMPLLMGMALMAVPPERGATAVGFFQATYSAGMTLGPLVTGLIAESAGPAGGFWLMGAMAMAAAAVTRRLVPEDPRSR